MLSPQKVALLLRDGVSVRDISIHYGIPKSTVHGMAKRAGVPSDLLDAPPIPQRRMTPQVIAEEVSLLKRLGVPPSQIATRLGISRATVYRYLP